MHYKDQKSTYLSFILIFVAVKIGLNFLAIAHFGFHRDELLHLVLADHLDWGYKEVPPFIALLAKISNFSFGDSVFAARVFPTIFSGLIILLTGLITVEFGGKKFAIAVACLSMIFSPAFAASGYLFQPVVFDQFWWVLAVWLLVKYYNSSAVKYVYFLGAAIGFGLLTKYTMGFFTLALILGIGTLIDTLGYLSRLGVNAIELMPVNEFEGNDSWGYNPSYYFAPDKYYGTKNDLKAFIDACHSNGMAVIFDMVLNHSFGSSPMVQLYFDQTNQRPLSTNPWYNVIPTHPYNVGYQFNHESAATKYFVKNVMQFWMKNYKIDGYRFDLAKGFTQTNYGTADADVAPWSTYDAGRVAIWKDYNNYIKSVDPNNFYVILEDFASNQEEKELADNGMMTWNNLNYSFNEATMGWVPTSDLAGAFFNTLTFTQPDNIVTYMESHDQERQMFKNESYGNINGAYSVKDLATGLKRQEAAAAYFLSIPGPKMLWQFGERGYDVSINADGGRLSDKPAHWEYMNDPIRSHLYSAFAKLIKMKINNAVFNTSVLQYTSSGSVKSISLTGSDNMVEVAANFDVVASTATINFPATGTYYDYMTGARINVPSASYSIILNPGEYHIYSSSPLQ